MSLAEDIAEAEAIEHGNLALSMRDHVEMIKSLSLSPMPDDARLQLLIHLTGIVLERLLDGETDVAGHGRGA